VSEHVRFGIQGSGQLLEGVPDPGLFRELGISAEELGYDSLWAGDHISFHNPILEPLVALGAFAGWTRRIALGVGVLLLPLRPPALVAKQVASLDYLSGGRVILGVGVGGEGSRDFESVGVPIGERGARADEALAVLRLLWREAPASFSGSFSQFEGVTIEPRPAQPGGPPILVGGRSDAALRRAGRLGDGWLPYLVSAERLARGLEEVRRHAQEAGRDPAAVGGAVVAFACVDTDGERAREETRRHLSVRYGQRFEPYHVERLCVAGTADECAARVRAYVDAGATHVVFNPAVATGQLVDQCERLYEGVVDPVRAALPVASA
jgi:probable F420-dependent oxidoreductase